MLARRARPLATGVVIGRRPLLEADPDLGVGLEPDALRAATRQLVAPVMEIPAGHGWDAPHDAEEWRGQLGLLVLDGLLTRDVALAGSECTELIGEGDLLRPWDHVRADPVPFEVEWEVLATTRLAVLDRRVTAVVGRLGEVSSALISRSVRRSRWLGLHLAIRCLRRVDARLLVLFWHLAERWGRVTPGGVVVSLPLTHELLARLIGAQRPSVTTALGELGARGAVLRQEQRWILGGDLPDELERIYAGHPAPRLSSADGIFQGVGRARASR